MWILGEKSLRGMLSIAFWHHGGRYRILSSSMWNKFLPYGKQKKEKKVAQKKPFEASKKWPHPALYRIYHKNHQDEK